MKLKLPLCTSIIILFSLLPVTAQQGLDSWKRYTVPKQEFSVALPTLPAMTVYESKNGSRWRMLMGAYADGVVYTIDIYENVKKRQSLADFIAEQSEALRLDAATQKQILVNGVAGREYLLSPSSKCLLFATRARLYRFMTYTANVDDPKVQQFFSSIAFGEKQSGIPVSDGPGIPYQQDTIERLYVGREVERKAILVTKPEPNYTSKARDNQITGTVILKAVFTSAGNVSNIRTVSGLPYGLTERAIDAARKIKFIPAVKDGHYVSMWMQLEYNFNLY